MQYPKNKIRASTALTLLEMVIALAIMATVFAAILPLFRSIQNSWDSKQAAAETVQNGRVLIDHLNRNLAKAVKITAVSDSATTIGYVQFEDNDGNNLEYDIANSYVRFGVAGDLCDLAGPASQLQFTCYDASDFSTPITDVNDIRFVEVETTLTNSVTMGQDKTFTTSVCLRTNANKQGEGITKKPPFEFDTIQGKTPALAQVDDTHYLCAYTGWDGSSGRAVILAVNPITWTVSKGTVFEFDTSEGKTPALAQIDDDHYLCAYEGPGSDGWAVVLTVNTGTWTIAKETPFEFDDRDGETPALAQIDDTHYLCAYLGNRDDGWATVLTVDTGTWTIAKETPFEFDDRDGETPALAQIDDTHYLCAYRGDRDDGWATVLTVDTGTWTIAKETPFEFDNRDGETPALAQIDDTHYLCAYEGSRSDGWAVVLTVNPITWTISKGTAFEYDNEEAKAPALAQIDNNRYLCDYSGDDGDGWTVVLAVDPTTWTISKETPYEYDASRGKTPALEQIDDKYYLSAYEGGSDDGWSVVLAVDMKVRP